MPLVLELHGSDNKKTGHLIIDRKNLIITYAIDETTSSKQNAAECRYRMKELLNRNQNAFKDLMSTERSFMGMEDPRHDALEHMSAYDRHQYHYHYRFKHDVDFNIIKMMFAEMSVAGCEDLISDSCRIDILKTAGAYFATLADSEAAQNIEAEYQKDKQREYASASIEATETDESEDDDIQIGVNDATLLPMAMFMSQRIQEILGENAEAEENLETPIYFSLPNSITLFSRFLPAYIYSKQADLSSVIGKSEPANRERRKF